MDKLETQIDDVNVVFRSELKKYIKIISVWALAIVVFGGSLFLVFGYNELTQMVAILPLVGFIWYLVSIRENIITNFYQQFAYANGYIFLIQDPTLNGLGALFGVGSNRGYKNVIRGQFKNQEIVIFNYSFVTGSGKNRQTHHFTVFEIDYAHVLPKMFLRSDKHKWFSDIPKPDFRDGHRLTLEGDFDDHFDLFVEEKFEIEALQIFTPDIMQKLQTDWDKFSLEFALDKIYIMAPGRITNRKDLQHMYELAKYLIEQLAPVAKGMHSSVVSMMAK